jgi:diketogulonate reductase-like aldo/keto reductase
MALTIGSKVTLRSGYEMPLLGLGVFQNTGDTVVSACLAAFEVGYRHIDSAEIYRNEARQWLSLTTFMATTAY